MTEASGEDVYSGVDGKDTVRMGFILADLNELLLLQEMLEMLTSTAGPKN